MEFLVVRACSENIVQISAIHLKAFQGEFLSSLGERVLNAYYRNYLYESDHLLLVAKVGERTIGFVAGTLNSERIYQGLFRNNFFLIAKLTLKSFLVNKNLRSHILKKRKFMKEVIKSRFFKKKKNKNIQNKKKEIDKKRAKLLSIAVLDEFRGKGVAVELIVRFENEMQKKGALEGALYVRKKNLRGIGFYEKTGWLPSFSDNDSISFTKDFIKC